jgi:hypothetical protein
MHDCPARAGSYKRYLSGTSFAMAKTICSGFINIALVMRMFDGGDFIASTHQFLDQANHQGGLAGIFPTGHTENTMSVSIEETTSAHH